MSTTTKTGGLVGLFAKGKSLLVASSKIDSVALWLVLFAGVITIFKKNASDDLWAYSMWFGTALGIAALLYEMGSAKAMARAWFNAKPGALASATLIWVCAFGFSINQWMGAASESQAEKTNLHKAAYATTIDVRKSEADAEAKVARLREERSLMKPKASVAAARATIKTSEAHRFYRSTDGCKMTKGAQTRAFCDAYASAIADVALWDQIAKQEIALGEAEAALNDARKTAMGTKVETSEGRTDLVILTKYAGMSEEDAQIFNGLFAIVVISIFLSFGSMRSELESLSAKGQRKRFNLWVKLYRAYYRIVHGGEPPSVTINNIGTVDGISRSDMARAIQQQFGHRVAV